MKQLLFGRSGLRVSELCLGTMTFGTEWPMGADYESSKGVFDRFADAGGTFIDTANRYTDGTSERWLGEFIASDRDHFVVGTKFSLFDRPRDVNYAGNHRKNILRSLDRSLERLGLEYIDLLWLHAWDFTTPVDEVMRTLEDLVASGTVLYLGISDTPAWIVSQANTLAELRGWRQFVGLQIEYSLLQRAAERDLLPMASAFGLAVTPWGVLGGGALTGKYLRGEQGRVPESSLRRNERSSGITKELVAVADELGCTPTQLAIAWARSRSPQIIPIIGARTAAQLDDSLGTLDVAPSSEQLTRLNGCSAIELGFPLDFLSSEAVHGAFGNSLELIADRGRHFGTLRR